MQAQAQESGHAKRCKDNETRPHKDDVEGVHFLFDYCLLDCDQVEYVKKRPYVDKEDSLSTVGLDSTWRDFSLGLGEHSALDLCNLFFSRQLRLHRRKERRFK